ncbi:MAG: hypothetical protein HZY79_09040 [Rhodoblastus sp.]|nr:MAG: hypothetical protein HZY79_09040 [Rhodoblastus sp.]
MTCVLRLSALGLGLAVSAAGPAAAGAFNPAAGEGVAILTAGFSDGRDFVDGAGRKLRAPGYRKFETQAHLEYGVTDWLAALARPRVAAIHEDGRKGFRGVGVGAGEFGVQARLWRAGGWVISAQALGRTPAAPGGRFAGWEDRGGVEARLALGRSFSAFGSPAYLDAQIGVRTRGGRADELVAEQTFGLRATGTLLALAQIFTTRSLESVRRRTARGAPEGAVRVKAQLGLVYDVTPFWSLGAAAFRTVLVRDGARESGATLSVWRRF